MKYTSWYLAQRYARAFDLLFGKKITEQMVDQLEQWARSWSGRSPLVFYLQIDCLESAVRKEILFSSLSLEQRQLLTPLIELLEVHKRLWMIGEVMVAYAAWYRQSRDIERVEVRSATPLAESDLHQLEKWLTERLVGKKIRLEQKHDASLIAGIRLTGTDFVWERSIRQQLRLLTTAC